MDGHVDVVRCALAGQELCDTAMDAVDKLPFAFLSMSLPDYCISYLNAAAVDALRPAGIAGRLDAIGKHPWDLIAGWRNSLQPVCDDVQHTGRVMQVQDFKILLNGREVHWELAFIPRLGENEEVTSISMLAMDRTAEHHKMVSQQIHFWYAFRESPIGMAVLERSGKITNSNRALAGILDYPEEELRQADFDAFILPEDRALYHRLRAEALEGQREGFELELRFCTQDRRLVYGRTMVSAVRGVWGGHRFSLVMVEDVTALKQAREKLERHVHMLTRALVPSEFLEVPGYHIAWMYTPAYEAEQIGGDFLDVFPTEAGKVGILIGDVSGKGVEAASLAAATRNTIRAFAYESSLPGETMMHTNSQIYGRRTALGEFVTVFLAVLDPASGEMVCANAGHPPPLILDTSGGVEALTGHSLPVGLEPGEQYLETRAEIRPGDKLILYTDGVTDAHDSRGLFGIDGLERTVLGRTDLSPDDLIAHIVREASNWARGRLRDDVAMIAVERKTLPHEGKG